MENLRVLNDLQTVIVPGIIFLLFLSFGIALPWQKNNVSRIMFYWGMNIYVTLACLILIRLKIRRTNRPGDISQAYYANDILSNNLWKWNEAKNRNRSQEVGSQIQALDGHFNMLKKMWE
ncbi:hypothetical protein Ddc_17972 [Ditylenchus destructor]|nr:hypothetical protein Ddc_17972 [Ditylenchus destructor]